MLWRSSIFLQGRSIVRVCESLSKLHEYISSSELKLPSSTVSLEEDLKVSVIVHRLKLSSIEYQRNTGLLWSHFTSLYDWARKLAPSSHPIRYQTETNYDLVACVFPRFRQVVCFYLLIGRCANLWFCYYKAFLTYATLCSTFTEFVVFLYRFFTLSGCRAGAMFWSR